MIDPASKAKQITSNEFIKHYSNTDLPMLISVLYNTTVRGYVKTEKKTEENTLHIE